ncbi:MAG: hypothetical protein ACRCT1_09360, partial [Microcoleaceae cyanobacterium]
PSPSSVNPTTTPSPSSVNPTTTTPSPSSVAPTTTDPSTSAVNQGTTAESDPTAILNDSKPTETPLSKQTSASSIQIPITQDIKDGNAPVISQSNKESPSCHNRQTKTISQSTQISKRIPVSLPHGSSIRRQDIDDENDPLIGQSKTSSNSCNNRQKKTVFYSTKKSNRIGVSSPNCSSIAQENDDKNDILIGGNQEYRNYSSQEKHQILIIQNASVLSESSLGGILQQCGANILQSLALSNGLELESLRLVQTSFPSSSLCQSKSNYRDLQSFI